MISEIDPHFARQFDRLPPHSVESEMCVLGSMMLAAQIVPEVRATIRREDFFQVDHQVLFDAICSLTDDSSPVDGMTVRTYLQNRHLLEECGGVHYLGQILHTVPSPSNGVSYAQDVREKSQLRKLISLANDIFREAYSPSDGRAAGRISESAQSALSDLLDGSRGTEIRHIGDIVEEAYLEIDSEAIPRIPSGLPSLDNLIDGFGLGEMAIIAGRPSQGKSLFAKQIARNVAGRNIPVGFVSIEEGSKKIGRNHISSEAAIDNNRIRAGSKGRVGKDGTLIKISTQEMTRAADVVASSRQLPYYVCERATRLSEVCAAITLMVVRHGCKMVFVDYLQLIDSEGGSTREQEVSILSRRLKGLIKRLGIAGVVVAQLNRGSETGQIRKPRMSDLRDSGQIEQDADIVLLIHRPDFYARDTGDPVDGKAYIIPAKNKDGDRSYDVELKAELEYQRFSDPSVVDDPF